jgi:hypothetical protein
MAKEKRTPRERFTPLFWATIKALWESGRFASVIEFLEFGKKTYRIFPSQSQLTKVMAKGAWDKNRHQEEAERKIETSFMDLFEEQKMGDREVVARICEGINAPDRTIAAIVKYATANGGTIDDDTLKKFAVCLNNDLRVALEYIGEKHKLVGAYAAVKQKISGRLKVGSDTYEKMTDAEVEEEFDRIAANIKAEREYKAKNA